MFHRITLVLLTDYTLRKPFAGTCPSNRQQHTNSTSTCNIARLYGHIHVCCLVCVLQHLLATFRSTRVASMACELNEEQASLRVNLRCDNGEQSSTTSHMTCSMHKPCTCQPR